MTTTAHQHPTFKPGQLLRARVSFTHGITGGITAGDMFLLLALEHSDTGWPWKTTVVLSTGNIMKYWWIEPFRIGGTECAETVEETT